MSDASIGGLYLNIYQDSSFDFTDEGFKSQKVFYGNFIKTGDTLIFKYNKDIPDIGEKAIITPTAIAFIEGKHPESLLIRLNNMTE